jgi:hypothetical protein
LHKNVPAGENFTDFLYDALINSYLDYSINPKFGQLGMNKTSVDLFMRNVRYPKKGWGVFGLWI